MLAIAWAMHLVEPLSFLFAAFVSKKKGSGFLGRWSLSSYQTGVACEFVVLGSLLSFAAAL